jgi:hypothetical protein
VNAVEPLILTEEEKAFGLDVGQAFVRRLLVSGKKDCCWCEEHLKCTFEKKIYKRLGDFCNFWQLSKKLREIYHISLEEVPI